MMQLIGMLDSPYVRRAAISFQLLGLPFEHHSLSVFRTFDEFRRINPVVKAPSLVCDDGTVLMDSGLMLDYAEALAVPARRRMPTDVAQRLHTLRVVGLALAACEKSVQIHYEHALRPAQKLHQPWLDRITAQLLAAYGELEAHVQRQPLAVTSGSIDQGGISTAVAWHFTQQMMPHVVPAKNYPRLREFSEQAEALPEFRAAPHGDSTYRAGA